MGCGQRRLPWSPMVCVRPCANASCVPTIGCSPRLRGGPPLSDASVLGIVVAPEDSAEVECYSLSCRKWIEAA